MHILEKNPLFQSIPKEDLSSLLDCLGASEKKVSKSTVLVYAGDKIESIGIVISGCLRISRVDNFGNDSIVTTITEGNIFAEVFIAANVEISPVTITALEDSVIVFLNYRKLLTTCKNSCPSHVRLTENLLTIIAKKSLYLNKRIEILSKRTMRDKIFTFLEIESKGKESFIISLNREEMANYLCVDRSALSAELSRMQKDGLIRYVKNEFEILD